MKRIVTATIFCLAGTLSCLFGRMPGWSRANAAIGTWKTHMAYNDIQQIVQAGDDVFVRASENLYSYNVKDLSITTYDRTNGLSDVGITHIAWSKAARRLIAVYANSNIDLVETDGNIINIPDLYNKSMMEDKTVNDIFIYGKFALLATNFGVVKVDVDRAEISESYNIHGLNIKSVAVSGNTIYALRTDNIVMAGSMSDNLIDRNNWKTADNYDPAIFEKDNSDYEKLYPTVSRLNPGGPKYTRFYEMKIRDGRLFTTGGHYSVLIDMLYPGTVQVLEGDDWTIYEDRIDTITGHSYADVTCIDIDPNDIGHVFAGSRTGLYEFQNGRLVKYYNSSNSPLRPATTHGSNILLDDNYLLINGIKFDREGNLWIFNGEAKDANRFVIMKGTTTVQSKYTSLLNGTDYSFDLMRRCILDSRGLIWLVNDNYRRPALICMQPDNEAIKVYTSFVNQDGTRYEPKNVHCAVEDLNGDIWVGTSAGLFVVRASEIGQESVTFEQVKVPRNDGTNLADYLMTGVDISSIAIDGAGRKWIGTTDNGVYLISADDMVQEEHFTKLNSKLLSDYINDIAIDNRTGEVFISTDEGLCSYMSDATGAAESMEKDDVYAYPNPVTPDYNGLITVVGLTLDADVKIATATGHVVAAGRSTGGSFTWDGRDKDGRRVASGVYNVITATSDGSKGTVCKIAIVN